MGVGKMGYGLLKDLSNQQEVSEIVAADVNKDRAEQYSERIGSDKIRVEKMDATDYNEALSLMKRGFDVVASGLPRPFCDVAAKAAIEVGIGYADVAASFQSIFELDGEAKDAGVTVVPHIGLDIGIDRVLCGVGARRLDKPERFNVWCGGFPQKDTPGYNNLLSYKIAWYWPYAVETNLRASRILKDGKLVEVPPISDPEEVWFKEPIGRCEAFTTGGLMDVVEHLELVGVKDAWAKTVRWPGHCDTWNKLEDLGLLDEEHIDVDGTLVRPLDFFVALGEENLQYNLGEGDVVCQRVEVSGYSDGNETSYLFEFIDLYDLKEDISAMARTTAFPCSITAQMIANGELSYEGVMHPSKIGFNEKYSKKFFQELGKRGIKIEEYERRILN